MTIIVFCDYFALVYHAVFVELRYLFNKINHLDSASAIDTGHPVTFRISFGQKIDHSDSASAIDTEHPKKS